MIKQMIFVPCFLVGLLSAATALAQEYTKTGGQNMTINQNHQLVLRLFGEVFGRHSISVIDELYDPDVVDHSAFPEQAPGVVGIKSAINGFFERTPTSPRTKSRPRSAGSWGLPSRPPPKRESSVACSGGDGTTPRFHIYWTSDDGK
jgi:hypothetical protein